ncbi:MULTISPECIES: hypothetical protein [unclassified Rhizobium]|uniref:hypothetical protein n=1 Tax=unclassified Rhizobium TaxID=2613769 RepID=UPI00160DF90E|nr:MULTISPECIES: hypothetical protein [unclassified Rhizobium]MBB3317669.1 hypothetical protein [Rhizobium sp. BK181]MBB3544574.1 hypothetical protein [Rhizobium sp. BK399]
MRTEHCYRWFRWMVFEHALLLVIAVMIATIFSVLFDRPGGDLTRREFHLQRSAEGRPGR